MIIDLGTNETVILDSILKDAFIKAMERYYRHKGKQEEHFESLVVQANIRAFS